MAPRTTLTVWQWNCRSYRTKRGHLQLHIQHNTQDTPDIIALHETNTPVKLPGYTPYNQLGPANGPHPNTAILVHRNLTATQHEIESTDIQHTLLEILPRRRGDSPLFVLSIYNSPRDKGTDIPLVLRKASLLAKGAQLLILGDFNAKHLEWGYPKPDRKGTRLWETAQDLGLTILNDPQQPTRVGNSVCRDTTPDLSLCKNIPGARWQNTGHTVGSDHYILSLSFETAASRAKTATARITKWDKFRQLRKKQHPTPYRISTNGSGH